MQFLNKTTFQISKMIIQSQKYTFCQLITLYLHSSVIVLTIKNVAFQKKLFFIFVRFGALRPKSTAMVMAGRSVHLTKLFSWASLNKQLTSTSCTYFRL